jgi:hypothetical protein
MIQLSCGEDQISVNIQLVPHWLLSLPPQSRSHIEPDPPNLRLHRMDHPHQHDAMEIDWPADQFVPCKSMIKSPQARYVLTCNAASELPVLPVPAMRTFSLSQRRSGQTASWEEPMEGQSWHRLPTYAPNGIQLSGLFTSGPSIDCLPSNLFIVPMASYSTHGESLPTRKRQHLPHLRLHQQQYIRSLHGTSCR